MDIFERIKQNPGPLGQFADYGEGYFKFSARLEGPIVRKCQFQSQRSYFWSANDYLGLCNHPEVIEADAKAATEYGMFYPMGARAMSGETDQHLQLEKELAEFVQKESAYLLNFGYQGMVSTIDALVNRNDVIVYDMDSHACIVDGVRLHSGFRQTATTSASGWNDTSFKTKGATNMYLSGHYFTGDGSGSYTDNTIKNDSLATPITKSVIYGRGGGSVSVNGTELSLGGNASVNKESDYRFFPSDKTKRFIVEKKKALAEKNLKEGQEFQAAFGAKEGVVTLESGLQYEILEASEEESLELKILLFAIITGTTITGQQGYRGWTEALQLMSTAAKWKLVIPPHLAIQTSKFQKIGTVTVL
ncbi:hypothetical protein FQR65_LT14987 [Abscondita terminalis]|nr:hypothetical protein FQR65_LT14987 [Abscondita terminalis]